MDASAEQPVGSGEGERSGRERPPREPSGAERTDGEGAGDEPEMGPEVSSFLVELGRLVQKHQVYPLGHPALSTTGRRAAEGASEALDELGKRREMRITVLRETLEVEGEQQTSRDNRVCRSLAESLHKRHAATLRVKRGVSESELRDLGRWLAGDLEDGDEGGEGGDGAEPGGRAERLEELSAPPKLEHLVVELLPYEALRLRRSDLDPERADAGAEQIWREMAAVAHGLPDAEELEEAQLEAEAVGEALGRRIGDPGVAELTRSLTERVLRRTEPPPAGAADAGGEASEYVERLDEVVDALDDEQLGQLLAGDGASEEDVRALLLEAAPHLSPENLERMVRAADDHEYLEISGWLVRVLNKLVRHSRSEVPALRVAAEGQVRRQVRDMVVRYHGDSPHTTAYADALRHMSEPGPDPLGPDLSLAPPSAERLLQTAVEADCESELVLGAWEQFRESTPLRDVVAWVAAAPAGELTRRLRREIREREESPLEALLAEQPPAEEAAGRVIEWAGRAAIPKLLDILEEAERRGVRRFAFDRLTSFGEPVREHVADRLDDDRWYVRRNMLAVLSRVDDPPFDVPLARYLRDPHEAVRREAVRLGMLDPGWRDQALEAALASDDRQTLTVGLAAALDEGYPADLASRIAEIAREEEHAMGVRRRAVRALGASGDRAAYETLLSLARRRSWPFFWRYRLRERSGVVGEALSALAEGWAEEPEAAELLREARESGDPELREAAEAG